MFRAYPAAWISISAGVTSIMQADKVDYNIGDMYNKSTFKATVPVDGIYHIDAKCAIASAGSGSTSTSLAYIYKNNQILSESQRIAGSGNNLTRPIPSISGDFLLKQGDVIDVRAHCSESRNFGGDSRLSHFSMRLICPFSQN